MIFIYTLSSSSSPNDIRYIGKTKNIKDRIRRHISKYYLNLEDNYKNRWIKSEVSKGNKILIEEIDLVNEEGWEESEKYWIEQFRNWGFRLVNTTDGGDGITLTKELIEKRNESNISRNSERLKDQIEKYNIIKDGEFWIGDRECPSCNRVTRYKSKSKSTVLMSTRRAESENRLCNYCKIPAEKSYFYGKKLNDGKLKQERYGKKILQFDIEDNLVNEFSSIREASEKTGIDRKSISNCARGIKHFHTAHGYKFKIKE
jgi:group I intron endonuclease